MTFFFSFSAGTMSSSDSDSFSSSSSELEEAEAEEGAEEEASLLFITAMEVKLKIYRDALVICVVKNFESKI